MEDFQLIISKNKKTAEMSLTLDGLAKTLS